MPREDHKFVSTQKGSLAMRYSCGNLTFDRTINGRCMRCGKSVIFDRKYASGRVYRKNGKGWDLIQW